MSGETQEFRGFDAYSSETLALAGRRFIIRRATEADVPALVALLRDDVLGAAREGSAGEGSAGAGSSGEGSSGEGSAGADVGSPAADAAVADDAAAYARAFALIANDSNQLLVAVEEGPAVVGTLQLSLIPSLSRRGTLRLQIEAVRIGASAQGIGLGTAVFEWAHDCGRRFGAGLAQLTTDRSRTDAQRFYARLGYDASHEGLKFPLD